MITSELLMFQKRTAMLKNQSAKWDMSQRSINLINMTFPVLDVTRNNLVMQAIIRLEYSYNQIHELSTNIQ